MKLDVKLRYKRQGGTVPTPPPPVCYTPNTQMRQWKTSILSFKQSWKWPRDVRLLLNFASRIHINFIFPVPLCWKLLSFQRKDVYLAKWGLDQCSAEDDVDNSAQYTAVTICQKGLVPIIEHSRLSKWEHYNYNGAGKNTTYFYCFLFSIFQKRWFKSVIFRSRCQNGEESQLEMMNNVALTSPNVILLLCPWVNSLQHSLTPWTSHSDCPYSQNVTRAAVTFGLGAVLTKRQYVTLREWDWVAPTCSSVICVQRSSPHQVVNQSFSHLFTTCASDIQGALQHSWLFSLNLFVSWTSF